MSQRDEELTATLETERTKCADVLAEKVELEKELESLTRALFEEACLRFIRLYITCISKAMTGEKDGPMNESSVQRWKKSCSLSSRRCERSKVQCASLSRRIGGCTPLRGRHRRAWKTRATTLVTPALEHESEPDHLSRPASRISVLYEGRGRASSPERTDSRPRT